VDSLEHQTKEIEAKDFEEVLDIILARQ
jgi:hypothetical protein